MVYKVIGLMSGSSLDGLDIVYTQLEEIRGQWSFEIIHADCLPYTDEWQKHLKHAATLSVADFLKLHTAYGRFIAESVNSFIEKYSLHHRVHFIATHGHTIIHEPAKHTSFQLGDGATIAAVTSLPVISDLRSLDVALGGQGAPIVPIGDKLLFSAYDYWLNIGGIANITVPQNGSLLAFDICPANQILNTLASRAGKDMDEDGQLAAQGKQLPGVLEQLNDLPYYQQAAPKSLSNDAAIGLVFPTLLESEYSTIDLLNTFTHHIADQVAVALKQFPTEKENPQLLVTGGGAFNQFLIAQLQKAVSPLNIEVVIPDATVIKFKEAVIMALIGTLRWREETNVLSTVTGASRDSISGTIWMGHSYSGEE